MKITNGELFSTVEPMKKLLEERLPVRVSYSLVKLVTSLEPHLKTINGVRDKLIKQYGELVVGSPGNFIVKTIVEKKTDKGKVVTGPDNKPVMVENPDFPKFQEEMQVLFDEEVEVAFEVVKLPEQVASTCDKCHHNMDKALEMEPSVLLALKTFVTV